MTNIVMVPGTDNNPLDGIARHVYEISRRLGKHGFTVVNIVPSYDASFSFREIDASYFLAKVPVINMQSMEALMSKVDAHLGMIPYYIGHRTAVRRYCASALTDEKSVLHTHGFYSLAQIGAKRSCKRLVTFHGFGQLDIIARGQWHVKAKLLNPVLKAIYGRADLYTTFSRTMRLTAVHLYGLDPNNIAVVPHGVDASFFSSRIDSEEIENLKRRFELDKPYNVLFLGHMIRGKGLEMLLEAFVILKSRRRDIALVLKIGLPHHRLQILETVRRLGITEVVRVISDHLCEKELRALYRISMAFVSYHMVTGISTALLEAMASGIVPVTYKQSHCRDIVDSSCGVLLETVEPRELADALEMLADDNALTSKLGREAKDRALKYYDWDRVVVPKYASLYNRLVGG